GGLSPFDRTRIGRELRDDREACRGRRRSCCGGRRWRRWRGRCHRGLLLAPGGKHHQKNTHQNRGASSFTQLCPPARNSYLPQIGISFLPWVVNCFTSVPSA